MARQCRWTFGPWARISGLPCDATRGRSAVAGLAAFENAFGADLVRGIGACAWLEDHVSSRHAFGGLSSGQALNEKSEPRRRRSALTTGTVDETTRSLDSPRCCEGVNTCDYTVPVKSEGGYSLNLGKR